MELAPLDPATYAALRLAVFGLRRGTRARSFPPVLHMGSLGEQELTVTIDPRAADHGLRADVLARLLELQDDPAPAVWLTRVGFPDVHDLDLAWLAAASSAFAEAGAPLPWFVVVTKNGWTRPATGETRSWHRLRLR